MAISMLKIRRPLGRLIFNMGIAIPGKTVFLIETAPWSQTGQHAGNYVLIALKFNIFKTNFHYNVDSLISIYVINRMF